VSRDHGGSRIVIYPSYFNSSLSRSKGRRVPLRLSVPNPALSDIEKICRQLGLNPVVEQDRSHPRNTFQKGRIIVDKRESKLKTLYLVASELKKYYQKPR